MKLSCVLPGHRATMLVNKPEIKANNDIMYGNLQRDFTSMVKRSLQPISVNVTKFSSLLSVDHLCLPPAAIE